MIEVFRGITELGEIFSQHDDDIRTGLFCRGHQLQLVQASAPRLVVTGDYDLLLLNGQG